MHLPPKHDSIFFFFLIGIPLFRAAIELWRWLFRKVRRFVDRLLRRWLTDLVQSYRPCMSYREECASGGYDIVSGRCTQKLVFCTLIEGHAGKHTGYDTNCHVQCFWTATLEPYTDSDEIIDGVVYYDDKERRRLDDASWDGIESVIPGGYKLKWVGRPKCNPPKFINTKELKKKDVIKEQPTRRQVRFTD